MEDNSPESFYKEKPNDNLRKCSAKSNTTFCTNIVCFPEICIIGFLFSKNHKNYVYKHYHNQPHNLDMFRGVPVPSKAFKKGIYNFY